MIGAAVTNLINQALPELAGEVYHAQADRGAVYPYGVVSLVSGAGKDSLDKTRAARFQLAIHDNDAPRLDQILTQAMEALGRLDATETGLRIHTLSTRSARMFATDIRQFQAVIDLDISYTKE